MLDTYLFWRARKNSLKREEEKLPLLYSGPEVALQHKFTSGSAYAAQAAYDPNLIESDLEHPYTETPLNGP